MNSFWRTLGRLCLVGIALVVILGVGSMSQAQAQSAVPQWSTPKRIETIPDTVTEWGMVADKMGKVHLFWSQEDQLKDGNLGESIYYATWDGKAWSAPIDILVGPIVGQTKFGGAVIDAAGMVHVVFYGGNERDGRLYYSHAWLEDAASTQGWMRPVELAPKASGAEAIAIDGQGVLQVAYSNYIIRPNVYTLSSPDGGQTWSKPTRLFGSDVQGGTVGTLVMNSDSAGRVHVVWDVRSVQNLGEAVYYSRFIPSQNKWSAPWTVATKSRGDGTPNSGDYEAAYPNVFAVGDQEIHLLYEHGNLPWRFSRWSKDGGETWTAPERVFDLVGQNGMVGPMAVDSAGHLYAITHGRYSNGVGKPDTHGMFFASWEGDHWSNRTPIVEGRKIDDFDPTHPRLVAYGGNQLLAIYGNDPKRGIWYSQAQTNAPPVTPVPYPTPARTATPTPDATEQAAGAAGQPATPTPTPRADDDTVDPTATDDQSGGPLLAGVLPAAVVVLAAMAFVSLRRVRSHR